MIGYSVRILLINDQNQILLLCADDPSTTDLNGNYRGTFWFSPGGKPENEETLKEAAVRELFEETGLKEDQVRFGPVVWKESFTFVLHKVPTRLHQKFIVAKTSEIKTTFDNLMPEERPILKELRWFSVEDIRNCPETIYPHNLAEHLPAILEGRYPEELLDISESRPLKVAGEN